MADGEQSSTRRPVAVARSIRLLGGLPFQDHRPTAANLPDSLIIPVEAISVLQPDGTLKAGTQPPMADEETLAALRLMMLSRTVDDGAVGLQRLGGLGPYGAG